MGIFSLHEFCSSFPQLSLHVTALVLSLVFWKRYPNVCVLVLAGSLLNLFAIATRFVLPVLLDFPFEKLLSFGFIGSLINVAGSGLYLLAAFTGRAASTPRPTRPTRRYDDDDWDRPAKPSSAPIPPETGSTGIQEPKP